MVELKIISNRRWRESYNLTHTWCWCHRFWFLSGFTSIYPLEKMIQWGLGSSSLSHHRWHCSMGFHSEQLLQPSCTILCLGHGPQKLTVPPWIKKIPRHFLHLESLWFFSYFYFLLSLFSLSWHLALPVPAISLLLLCLLSAILGLK